MVFRDVCRVNAYTVRRRWYNMASAGTLALIFMTLMNVVGLETNDLSGILDAVLNMIESAISFLILGILALLYLLGLIPNPFPWIVF